MDYLLTIAIPTYNRKKFLSRLLNSILCQYDERIEILVSDNASTDGTDELMMTAYPQIKYIRNKENIGGDANFLQCYQMATGKYIWLIGSDDIVVDGAIHIILNHIENNNVTIFFLNHTFFSGKDYKTADRTKPFLRATQGYFPTKDKCHFIAETRYEMSFMSAFILSRKAFLSVDTPQKYIGSYFIHTCIAFEGSRGEKTEFGIIYFPCIDKDSTPGNSNIVERNLVFKVFGHGLRFALVNIACQFGYNKHQMKKMHLDFILNNNSWPRMILGFKARGMSDWRKTFWEYGYPAIKDYPMAWLTIMPTLLVPDVVARVLRNLFGHKTTA